MIRVYLPIVSNALILRVFGKGFLAMVFYCISLVSFLFLIFSFALVLIRVTYDAYAPQEDGRQ